MKSQLLAVLLVASARVLGVSVHNEDILKEKRHLVLYADGVAKEIIDAKQPVINSWREGMFELRNMCLIVECNYDYPKALNYPHRYVCNKCYIEKNYYCESASEKNSVYKLEEIFHEADYSDSITLSGEKFGIIANSKNEDAIIFEIGDENIVPQDEKEKEALEKKLH